MVDSFTKDEREKWYTRARNRDEVIALQAIRALIRDIYKTLDRLEIAKLQEELSHPTTWVKEGPPPVKEVGKSEIYYCRKCSGDYELCGGCKAHM